MQRFRNIALVGLTLCLALPATSAWGQAVTPLSSVQPFASNIIVPQARAFSVSRAQTAEITAVTVGVVITEQAATTTMDIELRNPGASRIEAELVVPVPAGAAVRGFSFQGSAAEPTAETLPAARARAIYQEIVAKVRDPALLEFINQDLIRSSVFPIEGNGTQKVRLTYEHLLTADGERIDYVLPRSESLAYRTPWHVSVRIKSKQPISTVYSPSHEIDVVRKGPGIVSARIVDQAVAEPGPFRLSYLLARDGVSASLLTYPDAMTDGGYFLLLAGLPAEIPSVGSEGPAIKREITLVLDRSGSMNGEKIDQVREAALQILAALEDDEAFNIITYNDAVHLFSGKAVPKSDDSMTRARAYLQGIKANGGTNIYDALTEALKPEPAEGFLPMILFLTDGLPTVGQTSEVAIRELATKANPHNRRIFTFGVGVDVNAPLLEKIAMETRATPTIVFPKEDVEVKVGSVFKRLAGPVLSDVEIDVVNAAGQTTPDRVADVLPAKLPDLFEGDQLVLLGRYTGAEPLTFRVGGNYLGNTRTFQFKFDLDKASTRNAFVSRLWASRKIATLVDAVRQMGADQQFSWSAMSAARPGLATPMSHSVAAPPASVTDPAQDPRLKELVDEIVRLSTEFGVLTEYTAFLAREGTDLSDRDAILAEANGNFVNRAMQTRSGLGGANQSVNSVAMQGQVAMNFSNGFFDAQMNRVEITTVQQINDRAFYQRRGRWVDSRLVQKEGEIKPARTIEFGSEEFRQLAERLAEQGRSGTISLQGDILMMVDSEPILIQAGTEQGPES